MILLRVKFYDICFVLIHILGMIMKLYLMRHAQAASVLVDPSRTLTAFGREEIAVVLSRIPSSAREIVHVMHSGVSRTQETAQIVAKHLGIANAPVAVSWLGELDDIDTCLADVRAFEEDTLLVSHFPFLNQLLSQLVLGERTQDPIVQFSTATMVCLQRIDHQAWIIDWAMSAK